MRRLCMLLVPLALAVLGHLILIAPARADEGWVITSFDAQIQVSAAGDLAIVETILVDFGSIWKHGILRDIPVVYAYDAERNRAYDLRVESVTDTQGRSHKYETSRQGSFLQLKIGDPNTEVRGPQSYRLTYRVQHALNGFDDHDELFWNLNGEWPVRTDRVAATVTLPSDGLQRVTCYQGARGSREPCRFGNTARTATFEATRRLPEREQVTIVVAMRKGLVPNPQPRLEAKPRPLEDYFLVTPGTLGGSLAVLVVTMGLLAGGWWRFGRDRRFTTIYYLTDNPSEETRPLLSSDPIVIEYKPPEGLRPAQMGVLLDESADTLDVTATIIDLAVRGYLHITEVPKEGLIDRLRGAKDWQLDQKQQDPGDLLAYARNYYNSRVLEYNGRVVTVPTAIVAALLGFKEAEFFEAAEEARQEARVSFS